MTKSNQLASLFDCFFHISIVSRESTQGLGTFLDLFGAEFDSGAVRPLLHSENPNNPVFSGEGFLKVFKFVARVLKLVSNLFK